MGTLVFCPKDQPDSWDKTIVYKEYEKEASAMSVDGKKLHWELEDTFRRFTVSDHRGAPTEQLADEADKEYIDSVERER